jgi:hypothetical protein
MRCVMKSLLFFSLSPLLFGACNSDNAILGLEDTAIIEDEEPSDPYEGAVLEIVSPVANSFLSYGEPAEFEAVLWDKEGNPLVFEDINWNSTIDEAWRHAGATFSNEELDVGIHLLRVNAELPNGERLFDAVGGILVQSENAGTYAGSAIVSADTGDIQLGCAGGAIMVIDVYGETAEGEADCILALQGQVIELDYAFDLDVEKDDLAGEAALSIYGFELPTDFAGELTEEKQLSGTWSQSVFGQLEIDGEVRLERISRDTSYYE